MTSSTFFAPLIPHTKLDSLIVVRDARPLSSDCQTNVLLRSRRTSTQGPGNTFTAKVCCAKNFSFAPQSLCKLKQDRFTLAGKKCLACSQIHLATVRVAFDRF